jgi:hypothetical protein
MSIDLANMPRLVEAVRTGNLVPFVGAGISRQAKTSDPHAFPAWPELINEMAGRALFLGRITADEKEEIKELVCRGKHLMAAQHLKEKMGGEYTQVIRDRFDPIDAEPGAIHKALFSLRAPLIVTTNYDCLLEDSYAKNFSGRVRAVTFKQASEVIFFLQRSEQYNKPLVFKIHGTVESPEEIVLAERDYRALIYREPGYRTVLSAIFVTKVVLMLGFSFTDPELTVLTESIRESLKHRMTPDFIVLPEGSRGSVEKYRLHEDFGLHVIEYSEKNEHAELLDLIEQLAKAVPANVSASEVVQSTGSTVTV